MNGVQLITRTMKVLVLGILLHVQGECSAATWQAGVARVEITPADDVWMAGYGSRDHPGESTLHPLWAKALVLEDAENRRAVLVTTDLLGLTKDLSEEVCAHLADKLSLRRSQIMLTSSHTHCGPVLSNALYDIYPLNDEHRTKIDRYTKNLSVKLRDLVIRAASQLQPVNVSAGTGVTRFAVNRRNNRESDIPGLSEFKGPVDHAVPVLEVRTEDQSLLAIVFGYACHNTTLSFYQWCGDYAGFAQLELESRYPGSTAMFFSGCGADQNPLPRRTLALAKQYGMELMSAVESTLNGDMRSLKPELKTVYSTIDLALQTAPTDVQLRQEIQSGSVYVQRWAKRLLSKIKHGETLLSEYPYPLQAWKLDDQLLVAMGGEVVVDYALRLKSELSKTLWVASYANDVMGYIPSLRVLKEGGYEGASSMYVYGLPAPWAEDIEERIVFKVHQLVSELEDAFIPLTAGDGRTIGGWRKIQTGHGDGGRWVSRAGELVGEQEPPGSGNGGVLVTSKEYANFEMKMEINPDWGVCSGIFIRSNEQGQCYQIMVDYHTDGNVGSIYGEGTGGFTNRNYSFLEDKRVVEVKQKDIFPLPFSPDDFGKHYRIDEWNEVRARVVGNPPRIDVWINGTKISEFQDTEKRLPDYGRIGIQVHGGESWPVGKKTRFRNIRIQELP